MSAANTGRRFERLLFFAGPLSLASLLVLFVAVGSDQQEDLLRAKCLRLTAATLDSKRAELEAVWQEIAGRNYIGGSKINDYGGRLDAAFVPVEVEDPRCTKYLQTRTDGWFKSPTELAADLRKQAAVALTKPLAFYGVEIPDRATISVLGTPVRMELLTLTSALQIALGPVLVLWLGSLYNTRHRESLYVAHMGEIRELYPHLINIYPVLIYPNGAWRDLRRRSWSSYYARVVLVPATFCVLRIALLSLFVGPPVAFYITSLFFLDLGAYPLIRVALGIAVAIFALGAFLAECLPWHVGKQFHVRQRTSI